jgi:hypothetical protein
MSLGTLGCWIAWFFVLNNISPIDAGLLGLFFFYFSLFLAIVGSFSVVGFLVRRFFSKNDEIVFHHVRQTFRQSILLSILSVGLLLLLANGLFFWWNSLLLVSIFIFIEIFLATKKPSPTV